MSRPISENVAYTLFWTDTRIVLPRRLAAIVFNEDHTSNQQASHGRENLSSFISSMILVSARLTIIDPQHRPPRFFEFKCSCAAFT